MTNMNTVTKIMAQAYLPAYEQQLARLKKEGPRQWGDDRLRELQRLTHQLEVENTEWFVRKCKEILGITDA